VRGHGQEALIWSPLSCGLLDQEHNTRGYTPDRHSAGLHYFAECTVLDLQAYCAKDERWAAIHQIARVRTYGQPTQEEPPPIQTFRPLITLVNLSTRDRIRHRIRHRMLVTCVTFIVPPEDSAVNDAFVQRPLLERTCECFFSFKVELVRFNPSRAPISNLCCVHHQCSIMENTDAMCAPMIQWCRGVSKLPTARARPCISTHWPISA
jgi:hypothetical protein